MRQYVIPSMDCGSGSDAIQRAIYEAKECGCNCVVIPKRETKTGTLHWDIDKAILLPSDITIILNDCRLRLVDGVYENIFRNENMYHTNTYTMDQEQHNIVIRGYGNAVLDGGAGNDLTEKNSGKYPYPSIKNNNLILLHNVNNYTIEGLRLVNLRHWAINQLFCRNGHLLNLQFDNGIFCHNQDGIDVRIGCNQIIIEHITGLTGDDTVALSAFPRSSDGSFAVEGKDCDIHDVVIRDVCASTRQTIVALRNNDGANMYRISISNISDSGLKYTPWGVLKIGENNYYRERPSILGETREISARDIHSRGAGTVFLGGSLLNSVISGIYASGGTMHAISTFLPEMIFEENNCKICGGIHMKNVAIDNVFYDGTAAYCDDPGDGSYKNRYTYPGEKFCGCALDFRCMREEDKLENVICRNVFTDSPEKVFLGEKSPILL